MKLIDITSRLYLKRLSKELNSKPDGFYASTGVFRARCNRAKFTKGEIKCHSFNTSPEWFVPVNYYFNDVNGQEIVASRAT